MSRLLSLISCSYGWQIDPFGHSNVVHEQFGLMGFDATVLDRILPDLKGALLSNRTSEFYWQTSASLGDSSQVYMHWMSSVELSL